MRYVSSTTVKYNQKNVYEAIISFNIYMWYGSWIKTVMSCEPRSRNLYKYEAIYMHMVCGVLFMGIVWCRLLSNKVRVYYEYIRQLRERGSHDITVFIQLPYHIYMLNEIIASYTFFWLYLTVVEET
jgi:hypothetical protein